MKRVVQEEPKEVKKIAQFYRLNERISAKTLRVIDPTGKQIGILSKEEALAKAKELNLDLVEVAPQADPPVAKIIDFQKFRYEENKKEQAAKKKTKEVELKELWFSPRIADHDLQNRVKRAQEFLKAGDKIRLRIKFTGREMAHVNLGFQLFEKILSMLGDEAMVEREPKLEGRNITAIIGRAKPSAKNVQPPTSLTDIDQGMNT